MSGERPPRIVVIAGPTASGKSTLAVTLAHAFWGEIVNADSMQVYRGMDIGTAKPTLEEREGIPHHLIDVVDPDEPYNAAIYRAQALSAIREICARGNTCFVVGGTGLYIRGLMGGLMEAPPSDPGIRERLREECARHGSPRLHERLRGLDPAAAAGIHPNDPVRIIRALEIVLLSHRRASDLMKGHRFRTASVEALLLCLEVERERLYRRINQRTERMAERGILEETRRLLNRGYSPDLKPMKAIGYRHMVRHLRGEFSFREAVEALKRDTRRYAKRQLTWFRGESRAIWVDPNQIDGISDQIRLFLHETA